MIVVRQNRMVVFISSDSNRVACENFSISLVGDFFRVVIGRNFPDVVFKYSAITSINGDAFDPTDEDNTPVIALNLILGTVAATANSAYLYTSSEFINVETAATGSNYTAFEELACDGLQINNDTGTALNIKKGGVATVLPSGISRYYGGITNASEISVKRVDSSNTQVTLYADAITV